MIRLACREELYAHFPPGIGAEIGVHVGNNAEALLRIAEPGRLVLIDPWCPEWLLFDGGDVGTPGEVALAAVRERFAAEIQSGRVQIVRGLSWEELEKFPDGYFSWAYLDTSHQYAETARELELLGRKVSRAGIIAGHDYCAEYPGVPEAVEEFCRAFGWRLAYVTDAAGERWPSFALLSE